MDTLLLFLYFIKPLLSYQLRGKFRGKQQKLSNYRIYELKTVFNKSIYDEEKNQTKKEMACHLSKEMLTVWTTHSNTEFKNPANCMDPVIECTKANDAASLQPLKFLAVSSTFY